MIQEKVIVPPLLAINIIKNRQTMEIAQIIELGIRTLISLYLCRYLETLLRQVSNGHIAYFPAMKAFVNLPTENELTFNAEEYSDISGTNTRM